MARYICKTCGTQYPDADQPPPHCPICEDERQYVGHNGQEWVTAQTVAANHQAVIREAEPNLTGIGMEPAFGIGQRALLVQTPNGNILWDCIPLVSDDIVEFVNGLGGIAAIAISHPHFYTNMVGWSRVFDAPVYVHQADREWVMNPDPVVQFWQGETLLLNEDLTLIRVGGHFPGGQVLHWSRGAGGRGVLLTGDMLYVTADRRYVSFMYSYPNLIPLAPSKVLKVVSALAPYEYDRIYSGWFDSVLPENAKANVAFSAERYVDAVTG